MRGVDEEMGASSMIKRLQCLNACMKAEAKHTRSEQISATINSTITGGEGFDVCVFEAHLYAWT